MNEKSDDGPLVWQPTKYQHLFRYVPSGTIFARFKIRGKQVRRSLKTASLDLAKSKLAELERTQRVVADERRRGKMLFGEALEQYLRTVQCDATLKPKTMDYYAQRVRTLWKTWPELEDLDLRRISASDCEEWAERFAAQYSASSYNHTISLVKHAFDLAVRACVRYDNPAKELGRKEEKMKVLDLPSSAQFDAFINEVEHSGSGKSKPCANLIRFLAYSGCRKSEAARVTFGDLDFDAGRTISHELSTMQRRPLMPRSRRPSLPRLSLVVLVQALRRPLLSPDVPDSGCRLQKQAGSAAHKKSKPRS